jgi:short-subunit dehydrogenase
MVDDNNILSMQNQKLTALITGASSGIGAALARKFSAEGFNVVLVARDQERLIALATSLRAEFGIQAHPVVVDLVHSDSTEILFAAVQHLEIDILVNNAGFGVHGAFAQNDLQQEAALVDLQIQSFLSLTKRFLNPMILRRRGKILNIASVYAYVPVPFQAVYGASKAFMLSFSNALREEVRPYGIQITVVCPGSTRTEFRRRLGVEEKNPGSGMSPEKVADQAFGALIAGRSTALTGVLNQIVIEILRHFSGHIAAKAMHKINQLRGMDKKK